MHVIYMLRMVLWRLIALLWCLRVCVCVCCMYGSYVNSFAYFACSSFLFFVSSCVFVVVGIVVVCFFRFFFRSFRTKHIQFRIECARTHTHAHSLACSYVYTVCRMCFDSHFCVSASLVWMLSVAYIFGVTTLTVQPNVYTFIRTFNRSLPFLGILSFSPPLGR